jgi:hypothetical protein
MKSIVTIILLLAGILCLSSCSNKDTKTINYTHVPSADSVSKGSTLTIALGTIDTFTLTDLTVTATPIEFLYASDIFNVNDSFWMATILVTDYRLKQIALNLNATNTNPNHIDTGYYYVTTNNSTLTDYSKGENKTYTVTIGSWLHITRSYSPVIGTMSLNLYYNHATITATGNFSIYK